jgi:hypothetical protein
LHQAIEPGPAQVILLVQVLLVHVADSCMARLAKGTEAASPWPIHQKSC